MVDAIKSNQDYYLPEKTNYINEKSGGLSDPNTFLKILVAQMQYQNPMEPSDSNAFITQLTQLATMEQMNNVSTSMNNLASKYEMSRYYELIGQQVTLSQGDNLVTGTVGGVVMVDDKPYFYLAGAPDGNKYSLDQVKGVAGSAYIDILPYLTIVGKTVKAGDENGEVTGVVEKVLFNNGGAAIQINGKTYSISNILEISNPPATGTMDNGTGGTSEPETTPAAAPVL
ncbi:flagellar hook assembly protein FlgD [Desulfotruncus alcoholivorax]|uniref:flagellar hook assembly protein FlgD n=1 Tax=Desulfotruncus alcoholivorax TaxID=265477 RepID=UPI000413E519|nr:flagellar hook capping FlgD N-terminal domain-containing protein [Desulfotruncus alcoholivorax]